MTTEVRIAVSKTLCGVIDQLGLDTRLHHRPTLWAEAREMTRQRSGRRGHLWAAIGLDHVPCSMGCKFCSFATPWTTITEKRRLSLDEVEQQAMRFIDGGADYLVLRTSECFELDELLRLGRKLRPHIHPHGRLVANTGCQTTLGWLQLRAAGFDGIYKTIRIREGIDTPFNRQERLESILAAKATGLEIYALVEPVGPEHTAEELCEAIITLRDAIKPSLVGAMARVPVPGSLLACHGQVDDLFLADLTAIVVLSLLPVLTQCEVVCSHPASPWLVEAGASALVVEMGAIPRDASFAATEWGCFTPTDANRLLTAAGYEVKAPHA